MKLVPLNLRNVDHLVTEIPERKRPHTVLFLDALDEDRVAIANHRKRLNELLQVTTGFSAVVITCRSQFFPKDEEIPLETGVLKIGAVQANEPRTYYFHKLYLAPFNDQQVERYLRRRFPLRQYRLRRKARAIANKIPDLVARPMLLAHIEDLVTSERKIDHSFQVYEEMVGAWLEREKGLVEDKEVLREFSELLAVDIFLNREQRGMERVPGEDLGPLAEKYGVPLQAWQLRGRSLLNRDAAGNYKFAHRSIMEYLYAKRTAEGKVPSHPQPWTDLIKSFFVEMLVAAEVDASKIDFNQVDLSRVDFSGLKLSGVKLSEVKLSEANLREADLREADLRGTDLSGAILRVANLSEAFLNRAILIEADLRWAKLFKADLRWAENLTCKQLTGGTGWKDAHRDAELACGAEIPEPPDESEEK